MSEWTDAFPKEDREIYELAGFGHSDGLGDRPALLVIDVQYRTLGDRPVPIRQAIKEMYPTACGEVGWRAAERIKDLIEQARKAEIPVIYPSVAPKTSRDAGRFGAINPDIASIPAKGYDFPDWVAPRDGELVIPKRHASAFFGTPLVSHLIDQSIDTVIITGCTTSGCVRATAVDSFSHNYHTAVVSDAVYDRSQMSHQVSLYEMNQKYADVVETEHVLSYLAELPSVPGEHVLR